MLAAVASSVLHGPQRTQRGLLLLGQAPDPCDIKALVGPVAPQRAQSLATLEVPEHNGPVIAATGEPAAIGTHLERLYCPLVGLSHPHALLRGYYSQQGATNLCLEHRSTQSAEVSQRKFLSLLSARMMRVDMKCLFVGGQCFSITTERIKSASFVIVKGRIVRIKTNSLLIG